jgi:hypothetical protein
MDRLTDVLAVAIDWLVKHPAWVLDEVIQLFPGIFPEDVKKERPRMVLFLKLLVQGYVKFQTFKRRPDTQAFRDTIDSIFAYAQSELPSTFLAAEDSARLESKAAETKIEKEEEKPVAVKSKRRGILA